MKITVCIGTPCHIKGARPIVEELQDLIKEKDITTFNTIIASFKEVEKMAIPIIQYCVINIY